jgi:P-type Cu+ transporter
VALCQTEFPGALPNMSEFQAQTGQGVSAEVDGKRYRLGSVTWLTADLPPELQAQVDEWQDSGHTVVALAQVEGEVNQVLALFAIADALRPEAIAFVQALQSMGIEVRMLTGDQPGTAAAVAQAVGIQVWEGALLPGDKAEKIKQWQTELEASGEHGFVGMLGDGINDAPALAAAQLSLAMGSGSSVAMSAADITLMRHDLFAVIDALALSRATVSKIRQNLFFAFIYNIIGLPAAALGFLNPVVAGAAMAMSSVSVVSNSLLLRRFARNKQANS